MSVQLLAAHFRCDFNVSSTEYPRLLVQTTCVDIGPCPYPEFRGDYYRLDFEVVQPYIVANGMIFPLEEMPRMKEKKGGAE